MCGDVQIGIIAFTHYGKGMISRVDYFQEFLESKGISDAYTVIAAKDGVTTHLGNTPLVCILLICTLFLTF